MIYRSDTLKTLLGQRKIVTMRECKDALGTSADSTVFRKLAELDYRTSYSHSGRYYTLEEIARFDSLGLWAFRSVYFSRFGTLLATAEALVSSAQAGYTAAELTAVLHVDAKLALLELTRTGRIVREQVTARYVYLVADRATRRAQLSARAVYEAAPARLGLGAGLRVLPEEVKAAIVLFCALLDERQRRLYAGLEAMKIGHGGDTAIAGLLNLDPATVARGRRELLSGDVEGARVRRAGAGRPPKGRRS